MQTDHAPQSMDEAPRSFIERARRTQILQAAAETVAEVGYARASLTSIARHAGISKGVITYHFANKDELLRLLVDDFFAEAWEYMEARIEAQPTATGRVREWIASEHDYFGAHRPQFVAMAAIVANHRDASGTPTYTSDLGEELEALTEILVAGQSMGELRDFDAEATARIILRAAQGVLVAWAQDASVDLRGETNTLIDFIEHAITNETAPDTEETS